MYANIACLASAQSGSGASGRLLFGFCETLTPGLSPGLPTRKSRAGSVLLEQFGDELRCKLALRSYGGCNDQQRPAMKALESRSAESTFILSVIVGENRPLPRL